MFGGIGILVVAVAVALFLTLRPKKHVDIAKTVDPPPGRSEVEPSPRPAKTETALPEPKPRQETVEAAPEAAPEATPEIASAEKPLEDVVTAVKRSTVFIQAQAGTKKWTGSGFVTAVNNDTVLIATNYHVLAGPSFEENRSPSPSQIVRIFKGVTITAVFDSGTKTERTYKAEPIAGDADRDLGMLRLTGVKDPPTPVDYATPPKLIETMPVYSFGFPFGNILAIGKGSPAVTIGKASISSIRTDDNGELSVVQIDGALNPGNSGGPIVDVKGRLVGVAVATIRESSGIGLAIPAQELGNMMKGRLGGIHVTTAKSADGKLTVKAEVGVIDPGKAIGAVTLHYLAVGANGTKPGKRDTLEKLPGVKKLLLNLDGAVASGELVLDSADGELFFQAVPNTGSKSAVVALWRGNPAAQGGGRAPGPGEKAPAGWKEYTPKDNAFTVWIPEKTTRVAEAQRTSTVKTQRFKITTLHVEVGTLGFSVEKVTLPLTFARTKRRNLEDMFRDMLVSELRGTVKEESDVKLGPITGREYVIQTGQSVAKLRIFVAGTRVFLVHAQGTKAQVDDEMTMTFLNSVRLPTGSVPPGPP